jgi:NADH-quinone oxidoreductase subunit M
MGFVLLGIGSHTIEGYSGAYYQLFSHGLISALLFLVVGVLYDRVHDRNIANFSGLAKLMPAFAVVAGAGFFASMGLPGFSGFIAEILVLIGAFDAAIAAESLPLWMAIMGALGLILAAAYSLWAFQRVWMGNVFLRKQEWESSLQDLLSREKLMLYPLLALIIFFGVWPAWLLDGIKPVMDSLLLQLEALPSLIP